MNRIYEMEEAEILALADEQVSKLIDYECALEGAPMLPPEPGMKPTKQLPEQDAVVFTVGGHMTLSADHAQAIFAALTSGQLYDESYEGRFYEIKFLEPIIQTGYHAPKIESKRSYSAERWNQIRADVSEYTAKLAEWEKKNEEYQKALKSRSTIHERVWDRIMTARNHASDREQLRREFERYLELAEGNRRVALNFLEKVKFLGKFPELREEFCPGAPEAEMQAQKPVVVEQDDGIGF